MTLNLKRSLQFAGIVIAIFVTALTMAYSATVFAGITYSQPTLESSYVDHTFFTATTTTATSTNAAMVPDRTLRVDGAQSVVFYFSRGGTVGPNTGSTNFKVQTSRDGVVWDDYNTLLQNAATSTVPTSLSSITIGAATSTVSAYMQYNGFHFVRCIAVETTDGEHTCKASATY